MNKTITEKAFAIYDYNDSNKLLTWTVAVSVNDAWGLFLDAFSSGPFEMTVEKAKRIYCCIPIEIKYRIPE